MHQNVNFKITCSFVLLTVTINALSTNKFASSVFIFYDEGNKLALKNDTTSLKFWCSGALISARKVITAASCFNTEKKPDPRRYVVTPTNGDSIYSNSSNLTRYEVKNITYHEMWNPSKTSGENIAIITVATSFILSEQVQEAYLPLFHITEERQCESLNWIRQTEDKFLPAILNGTVKAKCNRSTNYEFCFESKLNTEECFNVQGGLLICDNKLHGIATAAVGGALSMCADMKNKEIVLTITYLDVGAYNDWIFNASNIIKEVDSSKLPTQFIAKGNSLSSNILYILFSLLSFYRY